MGLIVMHLVCSIPIQPVYVLQNKIMSSSDEKLNCHKAQEAQGLESKLNCLLFLKANNFSLLQQWRLKQERKLWVQTKNKKNLKIMSSGDVMNFMQTYQRITQQMFKDALKSSSIIMNLNSNHQIENIKFKKK